LARLYADENFPYPTVEALRRLGHDVLTAGEAGQAGLGIADEEVLSSAHMDGRAVLTHNRKHFRNLHKAGIPPQRSGPLHRGPGLRFPGGSGRPGVVHHQRVNRTTDSSHPAPWLRTLKVRACDTRQRCRLSSVL